MCGICKPVCIMMPNINRPISKCYEGNVYQFLVVEAKAQIVVISRHKRTQIPNTTWKLAKTKIFTKPGDQSRVICGHKENKQIFTKQLRCYVLYYSSTTLVCKKVRHNCVAISPSIKFCLKSGGVHFHGSTQIAIEDAIYRSSHVLS